MLSLLLSASIIFAHIEYDVPGSDAGREWVEIQNTGTDAVDLTGWKFFEGGVNHKLTPLGASIIPVGQSAIIVASEDGYRADHPTYSGLLFKSSFSLSNTGETLSLKNASGTVMATKTYAPAPKPAPTTSSPPTKKVISIPSNPLPTSVVTSTAPIAASAKPVSDSMPWVLGAGLVAVLGVGAAFMLRTKPGHEANDYQITEEQ